MTPKHPIQPLIEDNNGTVRFKENVLVTYILDNGGIDLNDLALIDFPLNDREQFNQLIGYSLSGYGELGFVSDETYEAAQRMYEEGKPDYVARIAALEAKVAKLRQALKEPIAALYGIHPDDLVGPTHDS